jgi:hypothetical protein
MLEYHFETFKYMPVILTPEPQQDMTGLVIISTDMLVILFLPLLPEARSRMTGNTNWSCGWSGNMPEDLTLVQLRRNIGELDDSMYSDATLQAMLLTATSVERLTAQIWAEKAARWAALTNVTNSSTTRGLGSLYSNALQMARYWGDLANIAENDTPTGRKRKARTRAIVRA